MRSWRRHDLVIVLACYSCPRLARFEIAGNDSGCSISIRVCGVHDIQTQVCFAGLFVEAMAWQTILAQDRADIAVVIDF